MDKERFWELRAGDKILLRDGRVGRFEHYGARGVRKPHIHSARRAGATEFVYLEDIGYVHFDQVQRKMFRSEKEKANEVI